MPQEITPGAVSAKRRIFIVDDHPLVREWLATLINQQSDLTVCGEAGSAAEALQLMRPANPAWPLWTFPWREARASN
jgi:DNA-binding LytR/AlgR family response regulator